MAHPTPARLYRDAVKSLFLYAAAEALADDAAFRSFLDAEYRICRARLAQEPDDAGERVSLFIVATGLLAFGRTDVIDDVLSAPPLSGGVARLTMAPWALLPVPDDIRDASDLGRLKDWLSAYADRLAFSETSGRFEIAGAGK